MSSSGKISFWRIFWPSLLAGVALIIFFFLFFSSIISSAFSKKPVYEEKANTVLHFQLGSPIKEIGKSDFDFGLDGASFKNMPGVADLLYGFEKAAKDNNIKGIFIELKGGGAGYATASAIRKAIKKFEEESGKFVIAYHSGEAITLKQYYIASAATENYGFPSSTFEFMGLGAELMFYKGLFDKLDIEIQIIRGENNDFKSAVEPFFLTEMSDSSRLQVETYLTNLWTTVKNDISNDRKIPVAELDGFAENGLIRRVNHAVKYKLLDDAKYRDEVLDIIAERAEVKDLEDLNFVSFEKYARRKFENNQAIVNGKNANIAVIIAEGDITVDGDGMASKRITRLIREARNDKHIKTIVLRVNSPGGSALASDEIWREATLANNEKQVIVSMGDVAASGGYYISMASEKIFAEENTITGSIGVFGMIPYTGKLLENKLGITFDRIGTNKYANSISLNKKLSPDEMQIVQEEVDEIYADFLQRVADGRGMTTEEANKFARGRVWTGNDALRIGLVDTIGGLSDAIAYAAKSAAIEHPIVRYFPKVEKDDFMELYELFQKDKDNTIKNNQLTQELIDSYREIKKVEGMFGIQARLPYQIIW